MNEILTNGTEIKQRVISEIQKASQDIFLAMAWFTDRDIANAIINAKSRGIAVEIILSSNAQNETVKQMLKAANVDVHAFESGDERGMMHHKFCLVDGKITMNGSYNYSYNASNNNVENIHVSDDTTIYRQFLSEFERLKYNIDHQIDVNEINPHPVKASAAQSTNTVDSFFQQLSNLVYSTANINSEEYKKQGKENSKESAGSIAIFDANYSNIKGRIKMYASDDGLNSKKSVMIANINAAYESKKSEIETDKQHQIKMLGKDIELDIKQVNVKLSEIKQEKSTLETGNANTGEKGLLQLNNEINKNNLERKALESGFVVKKFWRIGSILGLIFLCIFIFYLSIFFASAIYKVFFEGNVIRASMEAGANPGMPQLVDAEAIVKIFQNYGVLFGMMAGLFFLIPILLSNLKLLGSTNKWINWLLFSIGIVVFDVVVSTMVAMNADKIESLLVGKESQLKIWQVINRGEFWLIFVFGMLPLIITHFIIDFLVKAYKASQRDMVDAEKSIQIQMLDKSLLDLNMQKEYIVHKIEEKEELAKEQQEEILRLEKDLNTQQNQIENQNAVMFKNIKSIYDDFMARITSGKIFTEEIFISVTAAYKSGYIEYLPELYADREVMNRVKQIEQVIINN